MSPPARSPAPQVPAAVRTMRVLRYLAAQPTPVPVDRIARAVGMPRSSAYHLLSAMVDEGFVVHVVDAHRYALGLAAFEVGVGYTRQESLARLARRPLAQLVDRLGESAHLAILHGRDVLYVVEERAPGRPPLVSDVGVRLPAHLTASGRAILAALPASQVRALHPDRASFVHRHGVGPTSLSALRALLVETRQRGYAAEDGEVTPGLASVAVAVPDATGHPAAGVAVTYDPATRSDVAHLADQVARTAARVGAALGARP